MQGVRAHKPSPRARPLVQRPEALAPGMVAACARGGGGSRATSPTLDRAPEVGFGTVRGLSTVLTGAYIQALPGKGDKVGSVTATDLSRDATAAQARVFIPQRYARLVRIGSRFWIVGGVDVDFGQGRPPGRGLA